MQLNFACTECGRCCQNHRVPLSVHEAIAWLERGGDVHLLCDAIAWPAEPAPGDAPAQYRRQRSFAAASGALPVRVGVVLAASFPGRCPHLQGDNRCGIYAERPRVCRIYPASINPFEPLGTESKACPPEAWDTHHPAFVRAGQLVDAATLPLIDEARRLAVQEMPAKQRLCDALGIRTAAMVNEGFAVHKPPRAALLAALQQCGDSDGGEHPPVDALTDHWQLLSHQPQTLEILHEVGAQAQHAHQATDLAVEYLDLQPAPRDGHQAPHRGP